MTLNSDECLKVLARNNVPAAAYRTVREAMHDPQLAHRGAFSDVHDAGGVMKVLNPPFRMSGTRASVGNQVAQLGEHTRAVLAAAGLSQDEIDALVD